MASACSTPAASSSAPSRTARTCTTLPPIRKRPSVAGESEADRQGNFPSPRVADAPHRNSARLKDSAKSQASGIAGAFVHGLIIVELASLSLLLPHKTQARDPSRVSLDG